MYLIKALLVALFYNNLLIMPIQIAIAEDNLFLLQSIKEKLSFFEDLNCCWTAIHGAQLLEFLESKERPDLILMDIEMPVKDGIATTALVRQRYPTMNIIMLTVVDSHDHIFRAIQAGANGYLLKEVSPPELHKSIVDTLAGGAAMTPSIAQKALQLLRNPNLPPKKTIEVQLTKREIEILQHLSQGSSSRQIAEQLHRSPKTVRNHIEHIYKKLQVHSKLEAVQKARDNFML